MHEGGVVVGKGKLLMDSLRDLYDLVDEPIAVLRKRFLFHTEGNYCAAFILDLFYAEIERRRLAVLFSQKPYDQGITTSLERLVDDLFGLFTQEEHITALNLLINKGYISIQHVDQTSEEDRSYTFVVDREKINATDRQYWGLPGYSFPSSSSLASPRIEVAPIQPPLYELPLEQKYQTEAARVAYQCKRACDLELPATLSLEEWLSTLNHFEWRCAYCKGPYRLLEHFIPLVHGGGTSASNCVPSCSGCNGIKGTYHPHALPAKAELKMGAALQAVQAYLETRTHGEEEQP